jgi:hypothetical protein
MKGILIGIRGIGVLGRKKWDQVSILDVDNS